MFCHMLQAMTACTQSAFVIGLDPGAKLSYFAVRLDMVVAGDGIAHAPEWSLLSFGSVTVDFRKQNPVLDALTNPLEPVWESAETSRQCTTRTLFGLVECGRRSAHESCVVWEQQRGYLREHLSDPFIAETRRLGWPVRVMSPSEKYHRMGISSDKQVCGSGFRSWFLVAVTIVVVTVFTHDPCLRWWS